MDSVQTEGQTAIVLFMDVECHTESHNYPFKCLWFGLYGFDRPNKSLHWPYAHEVNIPLQCQLMLMR